MNASGILPNGATSADIPLRTTTSPTPDTPSSTTSASSRSSLTSTRPSCAATYEDRRGCQRRRSQSRDVLEYTLTVSNTGTDASVNMVLADPLPANTTFVAGSLEVTAGAKHRRQNRRRDGRPCRTRLLARSRRLPHRHGANRRRAGARSPPTNRPPSASCVWSTQTLSTTASSPIKSTARRQQCDARHPGTDLRTATPATAGRAAHQHYRRHTAPVELVKPPQPTATPRPGTELTYTINFSNANGTRARPPRSLIADKIPADTEYKIGAVTYDPGTTGLAAPTVEYTNLPRLSGDDPPTPWVNYTPGGAPNTYDSQITYVRFRFTGTLNPNTSGSISFTVRIR